MSEAERRSSVSFMPWVVFTTLILAVAGVASFLHWVPCPACTKSATIGGGSLEWEGKKVSVVSVVGCVRESASKVRNLSGFSTGVVVTREKLEYAVWQILDSNRFRNATIHPPAPDPKQPGVYIMTISAEEPPGGVPPLIDPSPRCFRCGGKGSVTILNRCLKGA